MAGLEFYILDTETNGLSTKLHSIIELGIIRVSTKVQLCRNVICETPQNSSFDALKITGKTLADIIQGHAKEDVVAEANRFFNQDGLTPAHRCIIGHNIISFDKKFLHTLWEQVGIEFPANLWVDTIALTNEFIKKTDTSKLNLVKTATGRISRKLTDACDMVGIKKVAGIHSAKADTQNNYLLWKSLVDTHKIDYLPHIKTFVHSIAPQQSVDELLAELENE